MMHVENYVVTITDNHGKAFREFSPEKLYSGRKSKVYIPYDSEYKIKIKNNDTRRIKLDISIDDTIVSGNGLIMNALTSESIERFVDVAKKFKFVRKTHEAVSDPTNSENGVLKVRVEREYQVTSSVTTWTTTLPTYIWPNNPNYPFDNPLEWTTGGSLNSGGLPMNSANVNAYNSSYQSPPESVLRSCSLDKSTPTANFCSFAPTLSSLKKPLVPMNEEVGATIEGSDSSQIFTTTQWAGTEGVAYEFIFKLCAQGGMSDADRIEYNKFLELKKKFEG